MKKLKYLSLSLIIFSFLLIPFFKILAAANNGTSEMANQANALSESSGLNVNSNIEMVTSRVILIIIGFLGIVFLVLTLMAGYKWMTAQGNETLIKEAKDSLKNSIIGLIIVLAAYAITYSVFTYLPFSTAGGGSVNTSSN